MQTSSAGPPSTTASRTSMMVAASRAATGPGAWSGGSSGGDMVPGYRGRTPFPTTWDRGGAVGRLAAPRSGRGVGAGTRPKRRGSSTMATTQVNGTDDETPAGPPRRRVPMALVTWVFVVLILLDRGRAPGGEDHPGLDHRRPPAGGARPRRAWSAPPRRSRARSSTPSAPNRPTDPGAGGAVGTAGADHRRATGRGLRRVRSSVPTARPSGGPSWPPSAGSGPSPTWARPRRRTPRSSPGRPTFTFDGTTYRSRYVTFAAVEEYGDRPSATAPAGFPKLRDPTPGRVGAAQALRHRAVRARHGHLPVRRRRQPARRVGGGDRLLPRRPPGQVDGAGRRRSLRPDERRHPGDAGGGQQADGGHLRGHAGQAGVGVHVAGRPGRGQPPRACPEPRDAARRQPARRCRTCLRSFSFSPPQMPCGSRILMAYSRQSWRTTQVAQMSLARVLALDLVFFALGVRGREEDRRLRSPAGRPSLPSLPQSSSLHSPS